MKATKTPATRLSFTNSAYVRSHGRNPSNSKVAGSWAFQRAIDDSARDGRMLGGLIWKYGTLASCKKQIRQDGLTGLYAILP